MKQAVLFLVLAGCTTGLFTAVPEETGTIDVFFCDKVDCAQVFAERAEHASEIACAMYHADRLFLGILEGKQSRMIVDEGHPWPGAVVESGNGLMHNKFCVFDGEFVLTGSWNPAQGMSIPNNVVFVQSRTLAAAYLAEFEEMYRGRFHGGRPNPGIVKLNGQLVEAYFCPEDQCQKKVLDALRSAEKSIHFMTFAFTDDEIGDVLLEKKRTGVDVQGVFDPRKDKYSEYEKLKDVSVVAKVHHKVFIVDGSTVITGSYNPSRNADERNDENIIIIRDPAIARQYENEFARFI
ncbi:MAG: phospholipase D-like domain-containing protein [Candidatus Woesearchaeota archaeon]